MLSGLPRWIFVPAAVGLVFLTLPVSALLWRSPWRDAFEIIANSQSTSALKVSIVVSLSATLLAAVLGLPLAFALAQTQSKFNSIIRAMVLLPLVLPPVATGAGLLSTFGRQGLSGRLFGVGLANSTLGAIIAATVVAMPFLVLTVESGLRRTDSDYRQVAATLGASPSQRLWWVTVPLAQKSLVAGVVLAWARSLGEFGATITFAGNIEGVTRTLPLQIALALEQDTDQALILSVVMVLISLLILVALRKQWLGPLAERTL